MFDYSFIKKALCTVFAGLLFLAASGCGGGGGGGGSSTLSYTGNTDPAVITRDNAAPLVMMLLGSAESGAITVQDVSEAGSAEGVPAGTYLPRVARYLTDAAQQIVRATTSPNSIASMPIDESMPCDGGSMRLHGTLNDDGIGTVEFDFNRCRDGDAMMDGAGTLRIDRWDMSRSPPEIIDSTMTFSLLRFSAPGSDFSMSGSARMQSDFPADTETSTLNLVIKDNDSSALWKTQNFAIRTVYDDISAPSNYRESWSGRFYDSVLGYVDIVTNQPMRYSNFFAEYPDGGGELVLNGAGNASIRVSMVSGTQVMLALDLDGDSSYELSATVLWTVLEAGDPVVYV
jgi:hypothetical protein